MNWETYTKLSILIRDYADTNIRLGCAIGRDYNADTSLLEAKQHEISKKLFDVLVEEVLKNDKQ